MMDLALTMDLDVNIKTDNHYRPAERIPDQ